MNTDRSAPGRAVLTILMVVMMSIAASTADARTKRLRLGTVAPDGTTFVKILRQLAQDVQKQAEDDLKFTIYPGGMKGAERQMVQQMRIGSLDAALLTASGLAEIDQSVTALQNMPLMFRTLDEVDLVGAKLRPRLEANLKKKGFIVLFWVDAGWLRFFSDEKVLTPDDLRKLKLFTAAGDPKATDLYKEAGFDPQPLAISDILPSLQTGLINAAPLPPIAALSLQADSAAPHMLDLNWAPLVGALVITEKTWNKLSPVTRTTMTSLSRDAGKKMKAANRSQAEESVKAMQKRGLEVHKPTAEIRALWQKEVEKVWPSIRGQMVPADLFDEVRAILDKHRAASAAGGSR